MQPRLRGGTCSGRPVGWLAPSPPPPQPVPCLAPHRAVFGAAVSKNVVPLQLRRGGGAAGGPDDAVHCEVEVRGRG